MKNKSVVENCSIQFIHANKNYFSFQEKINGLFKMGVSLMYPHYNFKLRR